MFLQNFSVSRKKDGFTLVEMLVVIVILAILATVALTVGPRMLTRAKAAESLQNVRQFGPLLTNYATDHSMALPPIEAPFTQADGTSAVRQWNEICMAMLFPDVNPEKFRDADWTKSNKTFITNPLFKTATPLAPGYAFNEMIAENVAIATGNVVPTREQLLLTSVPLAAIADPSRTPVVAAGTQMSFRYTPLEITDFNESPLKDLLSEDKFPVLFIDGHVEAITPSEYTSRLLHLVPVAPDI